MANEIDQEFIEERERQLPADRRRFAGDVISATRASEQLKSAPMGEPMIDYDVRSVYDSRPINAYDFNLVSSVELVGIGSEPGYFVGSVEFTCREGFVMIPREVHHFQVEDEGLTLNRLSTLMSATIDGADVPDNVNIPVGTTSDGLVKLFLVVDEFSVLGFRFRQGPALEAATIYVHVYGNYLRKTDRALPYEVGNPVGGGTGKRATRGPRNIGEVFAEQRPIARSPIPVAPSQPMPQQPAIPVAPPVDRRAQFRAGFRGNFTTRKT